MISTGGLNALPRLHPRPIEQVVSLFPYARLCGWDVSSWGGLPA